MKIAIIQPEYSLDSKCSDALFHAELSLFDACDESLDIIVMPEYSDIPAMPGSNEDFWSSVERCHAPLIEKASQTAKRCNAFVFVNGIEARKNTTFAFDRSGTLFGKYYKRHLTEGEVRERGLLQEYAMQPSAPYILEAEGIRFAFLTCYDFYFYEAYSGIARQNVDIIIGCSHQRSDPHETIELFSRFAAYNCNAYLLRASVSMAQDSNTGGGSMVVSPRGEVLLNMKNRVGMETVEFDPKKKYYKPAGFGNSPTAHYEYVERGRCPWNYRPAGSAITLPESLKPYPRLCLQAASPLAFEGLLPTFGAAIALDVSEIAYEVTYSASRDLVAVPEEHTDLEKVLFSEILKKFSCHTIMSVSVSAEDPLLIQEILTLLTKYDCERYVYFSSKSKGVLQLLSTIAPQYPTCYCTVKLDDNSISDACSLGCKKIQFHDSECSNDMVALAHSRGLLCNMLYNRSEVDMKQHCDLNIDTLVVEHYNLISQFTEISKKCYDYSL